MSYQYYNPNPRKTPEAGDCVIRAITKATGKKWNDVFIGINIIGFFLKDMPSRNSIWNRYLKHLGFKRRIVDQNDYNVRAFCANHPEGTYILAIDGHAVCVVDGIYYDSWDSGDETPLYYWKR